MTNTDLNKAGVSLHKSLTSYCGPDNWILVGVINDKTEPVIVVYTRTRKSANKMASFIGNDYEGFKVVVKALGEVFMIGASGSCLA